MKITDIHGWICPRCNTVHAPWKDSCHCNVVFPNHPVIPNYPDYAGWMNRIVTKIKRNDR